MFFKSDIAKYKKWRKIGIQLNNKIVDKIGKELIFQTAKDLQLFGKRNILVFDSEDETSYLMDRAIYDVKIGGKWFIEVYIEQYSKDDCLTNDEKRLLQAMRRSFYSLFLVDEIKPGKGVHLADVFSEGKLFLTDIGLSLTAKKSCLIATRVLSIDDLSFTSGCGCAFDKKHLEELKGNFIHLFEKKKGEMSWAEIMRKYSYYFFRKMRQFGIPMFFEIPYEE
jgi:hypothetical protein